MLYNFNFYGKPFDQHVHAVNKNSSFLIGLIQVIYLSITGNNLAANTW